MRCQSVRWKRRRQSELFLIWESAERDRKRVACKQREEQQTMGVIFDPSLTVTTKQANTIMLVLSSIPTPILIVVVLSLWAWKLKRNRVDSGLEQQYSNWVAELNRNCLPSSRGNGTQTSESTRPRDVSCSFRSPRRRFALLRCLRASAPSETTPTAGWKWGEG